jgi:NAD(P)-dependent dehydrogenase (short-subunit alcohol dehydrogenase family)
MRLEAKRILITGTGGGQGKAAQALFAREGARVIGCDIQQGAAERSAAELRDRCYDVERSAVDLTDPDDARRWIDESADDSAVSTCSTTTRPATASLRSRRWI